LSACGAVIPPPGEGFQEEFKNAPPWVQGSCDVVSEDADEPKLCGVGSIGGTRNISLARTSAVARARTDLARTLQNRVKAMIKDYQATTGDQLSVGDEQHVVDLSKQITNMNVSGTKVHETWVSTRNTYWAVVVLDVESFKRNLAEMKQINEKVREAIIQRADRAFKELDAETK